MEAWRRDGTPLPEKVLELRDFNASLRTVEYKDKSIAEILVFEFNQCVAQICTGAACNSYCQLGDLVLRCFDRSLYAGGLRRVFQGAKFGLGDSKEKPLKELSQQQTADGYSEVNVQLFAIIDVQ